MTKRKRPDCRGSSFVSAPIKEQLIDEFQFFLDHNAIGKGASALATKGVATFSTEKYNRLQ